MGKYRDGGVNLSPAKDCLAKKCPTTTPTATAVVTSPVQISQSVTFNGITAANWDGDAQEAYEKGFGAALGVYDADTDVYSSGCHVTSTASRRSASVAFVATVASDKASTAESNSQALATQPETLVTSITTTTSKLGKSTVTVPASGEVQVQAPTIQTHATSATHPASTQGPSQGQDPAGNEAGMSAGVIVGIVVSVVAVVGGLAAVAVVVLQSRTPPAPVPFKELDAATDLEGGPDVADSAVFSNPTMTGKI